MNITRAMLMAAGLGTRLKPFTDLAPKAFFPVMGVPAAQFAVDLAVHAGVRTLVFNVHHHAKRAISDIARLDCGGAELLVSDESQKLLGSAGGMKKALAHLGKREPFFLLNADVLCDVDLVALAAAHAQLRKRWGVRFTLALHPKGPPGGKYAEISVDRETGLIREIGAPAEESPFFMGAAVIEPEALDPIPDDVAAETVPLIFKPGVEAGKAGFFFGCGPDAPWKDVGSPSLWLDAHLSLIEALETGRGLPQSWRRRIEPVIHRVTNGVWISKGSLGVRNLAQTTGWAGPCYWSGKSAPRDLGPNAVLYGDAAQAGRSNGIGRDGLWVDIPKLG